GAAGVSAMCVALGRGAVPPQRRGERGKRQRRARRGPQERPPGPAAEPHGPRPRPPLPRNFHGYPSATGTYPDPRRRDRAVRRAARVSAPSPARGDGQSKGSEQDVAEGADVTRASSRLLDSGSLSDESRRTREFAWLSYLIERIADQHRGGKPCSREELV